MQFVQQCMKAENFDCNITGEARVKTFEQAWSS